MPDIDDILGSSSANPAPVGALTNISGQPAAPGELGYDSTGVPHYAPADPGGLKVTIRPPKLNTPTPKDTPAPDIDGILGKEPVKPLLSKDMTNDQILSTIGYSDKDISALKTDPAYKAFAAMDGDNFLAKDVSAPGTLAKSMQNIPSIGAFLHGADQSAFGVAQFLTHAANSIGATPDTTPAMFDALAKFNELNYQYSSGVQPNEYLVPKILGGMVAGGAVGKLAGAAGAAGGAADAGVAATQATAQASRLAQTASVIKGATGVAAGGAAASAAMTPATAIPSEVSQGSRDAFWQQKGEDAKQGAIWSLGMHGLMKIMFKAGLHVANKTEAAAKIKNILQSVRGNGPQGSADYQATLDQLTPLFTKPEYAERELQFAQHGVTPSLGDVNHGVVSKGTEKLSSGLPFGMGKFRKTQAQQFTQAASNYHGSLYDRMINTKFDSVKELEEAAKAGGPKSEIAKQVLTEMQDAHLSPAQVMQVSGQANGIRKWLINRKLFAARDALAGSARVDTAPIAQVAKDLLDKAKVGPGVNRSITAKLGEYAQYFDDPATPKGYDVLEAGIQNLNKAIDDAGSGAGPLIELQRAMKNAQSNFTDNVNKFAKARRYGTDAKGTAAYFKPSAGGGYDFPAARPANVPESEPGVRLYGTLAGAQKAGGPMTMERVKLRSPVIVEGSKGLNDFKRDLGMEVSGQFKPPQEYAEEYGKITQAAVDYAKANGHDGVVFTQNGVPQSLVDMTKWKRAIGDAQNKAKNYHQENLGSMEKQTNSSIVQSNADNILDKAINKKGVEAAEAYAKELDPKGRAAMQAAAVERAIKQATNTDGVVNPEQVAKYLHDRRDALGVFFKGEDKWALNGFVNLMAQAKAGGGHGGHGLTGSIMMAEALLDVARSGNPLEAAVGAAKTYGGLAAVGKATSSFATSPKIRNYLLAADMAQPNSPKMQSIYEKFSKALNLGVGSTVGKVNGDTQ